MNQILYMETKKKKGGALELKTILIIFAICIILFGGFLVGKGVYSTINKNEDTGLEEPTINISQEQNELKVSVTHTKIIDKITYSWNGEEETTMQGMGRQNIEETISIPTGTNVLLLKVTDISGKTATYNEEYTLENGDTIKPQIELLEPENQKVKVVAKDETELDYIEYYWNNEDKTKISAREEYPKQIEEKIDIIKGINTLTIIAVDKAGNETKIEQTYKGAKAPKIEVQKVQDANELIIKVTDEEEIQKIEYDLNGTLYSSDPQGTGASLGVKEVEFKQPIVPGENKISIRAYNISGLEGKDENRVFIGE